MRARVGSWAKFLSKCETVTATGYKWWRILGTATWILFVRWIGGSNNNTKHHDDIRFIYFFSSFYFAPFAINAQPLHINIYTRQQQQQPACTICECHSSQCACAQTENSKLLTSNQIRVPGIGWQNASHKTRCESKVDETKDWKTNEDQNRIKDSYLQPL